MVRVLGSTQESLADLEAADWLAVYLRRAHHLENRK